MSPIEHRLAELGLTLPVPPVPIADFLPWRRQGSTVFLAGQVCERDGKVTVAGKLGRDVDLATGREAARLCGLNLLACLALACGGDLRRVRRCLRVGGFVNCDPAFESAPHVIDGASSLFVAVLGEAGRHARTAVGVAGLPRGAAVEVDAIFEIDADGLPSA